MVAVVVVVLWWLWYCGGCGAVVVVVVVAVVAVVVVVAVVAVVVVAVVAVVVAVVAVMVVAIVVALMCCGVPWWLLWLLGGGLMLSESSPSGALQPAVQGGLARNYSQVRSPLGGCVGSTQALRDAAAQETEFQRLARWQEVRQWRGGSVVAAVVATVVSW